MIFLLFVYIKTFRKKIGFCIWMKITMTAIIERQRARLYTQKAKKIPKCYIKSQTLFKKLDNSRYVFIYKKPYTWRYGIFIEFWTWHWYTKSNILCVTWRFYMQKARHFAKSYTICDKFLYTKTRLFCVTQISKIQWKIA